MTKNITVLFDGDAAGLRASLRGIDLILEQGMNVKVCTFPEGEDPDSFAKNNDFEEVVRYLEENAKDFIQFKTSVLAEEAANDPIKRAEMVRDIVNSISKIPDRIKREIYVQECSTMLQISEEVLFNTLAQISRKEHADAGKQYRQQQQAFEVVRHKMEQEKVDIQSIHEKEILKILLEFGMQKEKFTEYYQEENEEGELVLTEQQVERKVAEKIYLELQEDEIEFADEAFREIYELLIAALLNSENFDFPAWIGSIPQHISTVVADLEMAENKYELHDWERKEVYVKAKVSEVERRVSQTITSIRLKLINDVIFEASQENEQGYTENTTFSQDQWEDVTNYVGLKSILSEKNDLVIKSFS